MRGNDLPKLEDVARLAGVSTATVSRCLNSPDQVVTKTRDKVNAAIRELKYLPNSNARALAANRSNIIGAIIPTMENAIFANGLQAFEETLSASGFDLVVASSSYKPDQEEKHIRSLVARGAEGLLLIGAERDPAIYRFLSERDIPYVISWIYQTTNDDHLAGHFVGFDNRAAMATITDKVIDYGHVRLAMIAGEGSDNDRVRDRISGFKQAVAARGIAVSQTNILQSRYNFVDAGQAFTKVMDVKTPPTVVICGNDVIAVGAVMKAKELGLCVPHDVSITGFDDIEIASVINPTLTTVHVPHALMGSKAAETLTEQITQKCGNRSHRLDTHVVERESLAAPKSEV